MINKERGECHAFYLTMIFIRNSVFNEKIYTRILRR